MSTDDDGLTEAYMAVRALEVGISAAHQELDRRLHDLRARLKVRGGFDTSLGSIILKERKDAIKFRPTGLLEWARANAAHEVIEEHEEVVPEHTEVVPATVHESLPKWLAERCKVERSGAIVNTATGEILDFAYVAEGKQWWEARLTPEAKADAEVAVLDQLPAVIALATRKEIGS